MPESLNTQRNDAGSEGTQSTSSSSSPPSSAASVHRQLRGLDLAAQEAMLAPVQRRRSPAPASGAPVQRGGHGHGGTPAHAGAHGGVHYQDGHLAGEGAVHVDCDFLLTPRPMGQYLIFKGANVVGNVEFKVQGAHGAPSPEGEGHGGGEGGHGGGTAASVGGTSAGHGGIAAAVQHKFEGFGHQMSVSGGGEVTRDGGRIGVGLSGGQIVLGDGIIQRMPSVNLNVLRYVAHGRDAGWHMLEAEISVPIGPAFQFVTHIAGQEVEITPDVTLKLKFGANGPAIARRLGMQYAPGAAEGGGTLVEGAGAVAEAGEGAAVAAEAAEGAGAAAEVLEAGAVLGEGAGAAGAAGVAAGVAVAVGLIVVPLAALGAVFAHDIRRSEEITLASDAASIDLVRFCGGYTDVWLGLRGSGEGAALARRHVEALRRQQPGINLAAVARGLGWQQGIYTRVFEQVSQGVKARLCRQYEVRPNSFEAVQISGHVDNAKWLGNHRGRYYHSR